MSGCAKNETPDGQEQSADEAITTTFLREHVVVAGRGAETRRQRQRANANAQVSRISISFTSSGLRPQIIKLAF